MVGEHMSGGVRRAIFLLMRKCVLMDLRGKTVIAMVESCVSLVTNTGLLLAVFLFLLELERTSTAQMGIYPSSAC